MADFNSQGFSISDRCSLEIVDYGDFKAYKFQGSSNNINVLETSLFPQVDVVNFDLVYYD